jgi:L-ascorbate metabolism protein UlaG (beta-lactamase superfamily)
MLIEAAGVRILTDPVYSDTCSPVPGNGPRRFHPPGIPFEELPSVDVVLVSHNHYDHLDRPTIGRLGDGPRYVVPPGLGKWFRRLGCSKVTELDWWEEVDAGGARITATPAQHWSKRAAADTNRSLWCGFAISAGGLSVFFAGDSGYCDGFGRIGGRIGPFTVAALPIGGYAPPWFMGEVHMNPEEAVAACADVGARILLPIHHGTFRLSDEEPAEPAERVRAEWERRGNALADLWLLNPGENRALTGIGA